MQPSETDRGKRWLENFRRRDRSAATVLLDSLEFVSADKLNNGLQQLIGNLPKTIKAPIALVPVRELGSRQHYFRSTQRDATPALLLPSSFPGSEAIIANIAGGLRRQQGNSGPFVATPSLRNLRLARCRSILFIDDFSGSGDRIIKFHEKFRTHPTIRSWESYKLVEYHVAVYAATKIAYDRLTKRFGRQNIHIERMCPTFSN